MKSTNKIALYSAVVLLLSFVGFAFKFFIHSRLTLVQLSQQTFNDHLRQEYEQYRQNILEESIEEDFEDNYYQKEEEYKNYVNYKENTKNINKQFDVCSKRILIPLTNSSVLYQNISIYLDWDDNFNSMQSLFTPVIQQQINESQGKNSSGEEDQMLLQLKINDFIALSMNQDFSKDVDILFTQSSLIKGRFDWISASLCYDQILNHIPGSNFLYGKQNLIRNYINSAKKYSANLKCLLEVDFFPKIFDLRTECESFEDYINLQHNKQNVRYIGITGSYHRKYNNFSQFLNDGNTKQQQLNSNQNITTQTDASFKCSSFWKNNFEQFYNQPLLVQEVEIVNDKTSKQINQLDDGINFEMYIVRINFLIASTKPLIVYCQNNELVFLKCKYGSKCNKRVKNKDFFSQFPSLNFEMLMNKIFKAISYTVLSVKPELHEDSRVFELFTADFSVSSKHLIKLEEIYPFNTIYKVQDVGYDSIQKKFLKQSLQIITLQYINKADRFKQIFNSTATKSNQQPQEDILKLIKQQDKNAQVYPSSNIIEVIINENLNSTDAYKYIPQSCF